MKEKATPQLIYYFFLILLGICNYAQAQIEIKTVVLTHDTGADLTLSAADGDIKQLAFNLNTLPVNCKIISCELQLTSIGAVTLAPQLHLLSETREIANYGLTPKGTAPETVISFNIPNANFPAPGDRNYKLRFKITHSNKKLQAKFFLGYPYFHRNRGFAPRLVITYGYNTGEKPAAVTDWASTYANYQHTSQSPVTLSGAIPKAFEKREIVMPPSAQVQQDLVMYRDKIYVVNSTDNTLYAADLGNYKTAVMSPALDGDKKVNNPAIDPFGKFYHVAANQFAVTNLSNGEYGYGHDTNGNVKNALNTGPDGSLYVCTNKGIYAYTPLPQIDLIWDISNTEQKSAVTLNKAGTIAYVLIHAGGANAKLTAIKTATGKKISEVDISLQAPLSDDGFLPTPAVDDNGYVYLPNSVIGGKSLYIYTPELILRKALIAASKYISMPAGMTEDHKTIGMYYMKDDSLFNYNSKTGINTLTCEVKAGGVPKSLIADQDNNIYFGMESGGRLYYKPKNATAFTKIDVGDLSLVKNIVMGIDGTLYTGTDNGIVAIRPTEYNGDYELKTNLDDQNPNNLSFVGNNLTIQDNFIFSNYKYLRGVNGITFKGKTTLTKNADVLLKTGSSGTGINFGTDFTVANGAVLQVKTGN